VALAVIVAPAIAEELLGRDLQGRTSRARKLTVIETGTDKEVIVTVTDDTEFVTAKGSSKIDLEKLSKGVTKQIDAGKKGVRAKVEHREGGRLEDHHRQEESRQLTGRVRTRRFGR